MGGRNSHPNIPPMNPQQQQQMQQQQMQQQPPPLQQQQQMPPHTPNNPGHQSPEPPLPPPPRGCDLGDPELNDSNNSTSSTQYSEAECDHDMNRGKLTIFVGGPWVFQSIWQLRVYV